MKEFVGLFIIQIVLKKLLKILILITFLLKDFYFLTREYLHNFTCQNKI